MRTCEKLDCNKPHLARGLCNAHYIKARTAGVLMPQDWVITFTYNAVPDEDELRRVEACLDAIDYPVAVDASVAVVPPDRVTVTMHLAAGDPADAVELGRKLLLIHGDLAHGWAQVSVEAVTEAEHERRAYA